jgi:hypothetical protein
MSRDAIASLVAEVIEPFLVRLQISRDRSARIGAALNGFQRLAEPGLGARQRVDLARRAWFPDALTLFEMLVRATGDGQAELDGWRRAGEKIGAEQEPRPLAPPAPPHPPHPHQHREGVTRPRPTGSPRRRPPRRGTGRRPTLAARFPIVPRAAIIAPREAN